MRRRRRQGFLRRLTLEWLSARLYGPGAAAGGAVAALGAAKDAVAPWWAECSKEAFNTGLDQLARALKNWGDSRRGKRKGRPAGFPRFRSRRRARPSIRFTTGALRCQARHAVLPRIGRVKLHEDGRRLAVADASFGEFRRQVEYKARWRGGRVIVADRWFASSKTCSGCGAVKSKLPLSERTYLCTARGLVLDRDVNAARNLAEYGHRMIAGSGPEISNGRGADRKTGLARQVAVKRQPGTAQAGQTGTVLAQAGTAA